MENFIGRIEEMGVLEKAYKSQQSEFFVIYGRRRVGKSELILQFLKEKTGIYYLGKKAKTAFQIHEFLNEASESINEPLLSGYTADNWKTALSVVVDKWSGNEKLIIALDEFQWSVEKSPELLSFIQELWDRNWKNNKKVMLILCGSYIGFMEKELLGQKSPLFGRRTAQILLKPFDFIDAGKFHPNYSYEERAKTFFICGGIPLYLNYFNKNRSVEMNIVESILNEFSPLFKEPDFLIREELRDVTNYYAILHAIASGKKHHKDISKQTEIESRGLQYYLKQLMEIGYIKKRYPLFTQKPSTKDVLYDLEDPLLRFWFRYIYPNTSYLAHVGGERVFKDRVKPKLQAYFGSCFERLCRDAMPKIYKKMGVNTNYEIGEFWNKDLQVDVVGIRDDRWVDIGECKWGRISSGKSLIKEIEQKMKNYPNPKNYTIACHVFVNRMARKVENTDVYWHTLVDLYEG